MEAGALSCQSWHAHHPPPYYPSPPDPFLRSSCVMPASRPRRNSRTGVLVCQCSSSTSSADPTVDNLTRIEPEPERKVDVVTHEPESESPDDSLQHPWDPHKPNFSHLLPKGLRPYPSFEGWFLRLVDFANGVSVGIIMATNYATAESQVTLLFSLPSGMGSSFEPEHTHSVYGRSTDAKFVRLPPAPTEPATETSHEPKGFEWESPNLGRIVARPHETFMDVTIEGYKLKAHMFNEVLWDAYDAEKGPEGWARRISILPTHWYVYSLGSESTYELSNEEKGLRIEGKGLGHQEKNWGETFPAGHVWIQAFTHDNKSQVVLSGAYFKIGDDTKTPYLFAMGYRSPELNIDMRTNDIGVVFKDFEILPLDGRFSVKAIGPSHTLQIKCNASPESFSEPLLCPIGKEAWKPACRESYCAKLEIEVYEHAVWGVIGDSKLISSQVLDHAGLEFGEDLLQEAEAAK